MELCALWRRFLISCAANPFRVLQQIGSGVMCIIMRRLCGICSDFRFQLDSPLKNVFIPYINEEATRHNFYAFFIVPNQTFSDWMITLHFLLLECSNWNLLEKFRLETPMSKDNNEINWKSILPIFNYPHSVRVKLGHKRTLSVIDSPAEFH